MNISELAQVLFIVTFAHADQAAKGLEQFKYIKPTALDSVRQELFMLAFWCVDFALFRFLGSEERNRISDAMQAILLKEAPILHDNLSSGLVAYGTYAQSVGAGKRVDAYFNAAVHVFRGRCIGMITSDTEGLARAVIEDTSKAVGDLLEQMGMDDELQKLETDFPSIKKMHNVIEAAGTQQLVLIARDCVNETMPELQQFSFKLLKMECKKRHANGDDFAGKLLSLLTVITDLDTDEATRRQGIRLLFGQE